MSSRAPRGRARTPLVRLPLGVELSFERRGRGKDDATRALPVPRRRRGHRLRHHGLRRRHPVRLHARGRAHCGRAAAARCDAATEKRRAACRRAPARPAKLPTSAAGRASARPASPATSTAPAGNGCELIAGDPCELDAGTADDLLRVGLSASGARRGRERLLRRLRWSGSVLRGHRLLRLPAAALPTRRRTPAASEGPVPGRITDELRRITREQGGVPTALGQAAGPRAAGQAIRPAHRPRDRRRCWPDRWLDPRPAG